MVTQLTNYKQATQIDSSVNRPIKVFKTFPNMKQHQSRKTVPVVNVEAQSSLGQHTTYKFIGGLNYLPKQKVESPSAIKVPKLFDWVDQWYCIAISRLLDRSKIHRVSLLDNPLAMWWDPVYERWSVFLDVCPHKLVPLSEGKVTKDGKLQCPYHGWEFSNCGRCEKISFDDPKQPFKITQRQSGTAFQSYENNGCLWTKLKPLKPNTKPLSQSEYAEQKKVWIMQNDQDFDNILEFDPSMVQNNIFHRDMPQDFVTFFDNVLDVSHIHYTHYKTLAPSIDESPQTQVITHSSDQHFGSTTQTNRGKMTTKFRYPALLEQRIEESNGMTFNIFFYAVPSSPGRCRVIYVDYLKLNHWAMDLMMLLPQWVSHVLYLNVVLDDDLYFLYQGEKTFAKYNKDKKKIGQIYSLPHTLDNTVIEFRRWLRKYGGGGPFGEQDQMWLLKQGPLKSFDEVYERFNQHTQICSVCTDALNNIRLSQDVFQVAAVLFGAFSIVSLILALLQEQYDNLSSIHQQIVNNKAFGALYFSMVYSKIKFYAMGTSYVQTFYKSMIFTFLAIISTTAKSKLKKFEKLYYKGYLPYPRNR